MHGQRKIIHLNNITKIKEAEQRGEWVVVIYEEDYGIIGFKTHNKMPWIFLLDIGYLIDETENLVV